MKPLPRIALAIALAACALAFNGCASIVKGTTQEISVASEPSGARVKVDGNAAGTTPTKVTLARKNNHVVTIEQDGFETENIAITKSIGGAVAGNVLTGGVIGWGVDAMTGAQYNLKPEKIEAKLRPAAPVAAAAAPVAAAPAGGANVKQFIDELNQLDQQLVERKLTAEEYARRRTALFEKYGKQ